MKRRFFSILLTLALCLSLAPVTTVTVYADSHTHDGWTAWSTSNALPTEAGNYYLTTDVTVKGAQHNAWSAPAGTTSICLEGHTIKYAGSTNGNVMRVYSGSTLHIYDKDDNSGKITGGAATWYYNGFDHFGNGGGVFIDGGTFYLHGGQITGNGAVAGGGVSVMHNGHFYMSGGIISNNTADDTNWFRAAGVQVESGGTFTMTGGTISGNHGGSTGPSSFARRWGVFVNGESTINISGSSVISGNVGELNLLLGVDGKINVTGALSENALIGFTTWERVSADENNPTVITSGLSGNGDLSNFVCNNDKWYTDPPANNSLRLVDGEVEVYYAAPHNVTITPGANMIKTADSGAASQTGLTGAMTDVVYTADENYFFPTDYAVASVNGIDVTRDSYRQITVSGTPTADAAISLTAPTAKTKLQTPNAAFAITDDSDLEISGLIDGTTYRVVSPDGGSADYTVSGTVLTVPDISAGTYSIKAVAAGNAANEHFDSDAVEVTITKAAVPENVDKTDCTTDANNDGTITGVDTTMEYQADGASDWTEVSGISITGLTAGTYHVRVKAAGTVLASEPVDVTIAEYEAPFVPEYTIIVTNDGNGTASTSIEQGEEGTEVTLTATPSEGYQFKEWQVVSGGVTVTENKFTIGTENVEVKAIFEEVPTEPTQVATPVLPASKSFTDSMTVTITCETEGAEIYYTTGGAITLYEGAFNITETTTVEAYATKDGLDESDHTTATYTKTNPTPSTGGGGGTTTYPIKPTSAENGNVTVAPRNAAEKDKVTITVTPDEGYVPDKLTVKDKDGKEIEVKDNGDGTYTFTMPASAIEIEATFKPDAGAAADDFPFVDVPENSYFRKPVEWAVEKGITSGVSEDKYGPEMSCTRAQVVTFLWITCGSEDAWIETGFDDVDVAAYYDKAVAWAVEKGITAGTSKDEFSPDMTITRAQFVTMLWVAKGMLEASGEMPFLDVPSDAYYAKAVVWAYANDITAGKSADSFAPDDPCTRAQIMTFLYNAYAE